MGIQVGKSGFREASIAAVVTRADGTVEDLGVVARWHKNPLVRLCWRIAELAKRRKH